MSIEAINWALNVPVGGNPKVILLGLANHAHPDGSNAYPALDTLAKYAHCGRSTARRTLRRLVSEGWILQDGSGPKGQVKYRLSMAEIQGGVNLTRVSFGTARGVIAVTPEPKEPSIYPHSIRSGSACGEVISFDRGAA